MKRKRIAAYTIAAATILILQLPSTANAQTKKDRTESKNLIALADKSFQQKNYKDAAEKYGRALVLVPENPEGHYRKGFAHFNLNDHDGAIKEFTLALSQGYKPLEVYRTRSYIYNEQKNYDAAIDDIRKGLALAPKDLAFQKSLGEILLARQSYPEALVALTGASKLAPADADIHYHLARVHLGMGGTAAQQKSAETALEKGTRFPGETFFLLADAHQKLRNWTGAIDAYQRAVAVKPDLYQAYRSLAEIFRSENRFNDAIAILKQGQKAFPLDGNIYTDLSWLYSLADRGADAVAAAQAGVSISPKQSEGFTNLCRAYNQVKNYDAAVTACNNALRLSPADGETLYYLGNAYVEQGKSTEANRIYTRAVAGLVEYTGKNPQLSDGWYLLGNAYFADRQVDKAIDAYLKCLQLSPKFNKARVNLGICYTRKKNKSAALEQHSILAASEPVLAARLKTEIDKM